MVWQRFWKMTSRKRVKKVRGRDGKFIGVFTKKTHNLLIRIASSADIVNNGRKKTIRISSL